MGKKKKAFEMAKMSEASEPETRIGINGNLGNGTLYIGGCAEFFFCAG